ncbi:hypothetical protein ACFSTD_13705 [Novosphingobium colocasiae]
MTPSPIVPAGLTRDDDATGPGTARAIGATSATAQNTAKRIASSVIAPQHQRHHDFARIKPGTTAHQKDGSSNPCDHHQRRELGIERRPQRQPLGNADAARLCRVAGRNRQQRRAVGRCEHGKERQHRQRAGGASGSGARRSRSQASQPGSTIAAMAMAAIDTDGCRFCHNTSTIAPGTSVRRSGQSIRTSASSAPNASTAKLCGRTLEKGVRGNESDGEPGAQPRCASPAPPRRQRDDPQPAQPRQRIEQPQAGPAERFEHRRHDDLRQPGQCRQSLAQMRGGERLAGQQAAVLQRHLAQPQLPEQIEIPDRPQHQHAQHHRRQHCQRPVDRRARVGFARCRAIGSEWVGRHVHGAATLPQHA